MLLASELPRWFVLVFAATFGAVWGSFANVVIYRWPRELSVVRPGSHCFACKRPVRGFDNVPVLAWFWLRGRCRDCGARFSFRYPMVEAIFAVVSMAIAQRVFRTDASSLSVGLALAHWGVRFATAFVLLVATFIDLDEMIVPWFVKWFALVPLAGAAFLPHAEPTVDLLPALAGAALGYLGLRVLFIDGYRVLTGRAGMGLGDAEILLLVGALLGPRGVLFALGAGAVQGVVAAGIAKLVGARIGPDDADDMVDEADEGAGAEGSDDVDVGEQLGASVRKAKLPFVPFLALAALEYLLGADALVQQYLRFIRGE